jgi:hypothetical protein
VTAPKAEPEEDAEGEHRAAPKTIPAWRRGMLIIPYVGLHFVEGIAADDYDAGLRIGGLVGARVDRSVSLNVELATNFLSPKGVDPRTQSSGHDLTIAFSPLFHGAIGGGEVMIGPKLGFWSSSTSPDGLGDQRSQDGWAFGFNLGAFAGVTDDVALGGMLAYQMTVLSQTCARGPGVMTEGCNSTEFPPQILSFAVAALF